jgi:hypothetical protein
MLGYLAFRFAVEFLRPRYTIPYVGLSAIQVASFIGALVAVAQLLRMRAPSVAPAAEVVT